VLLCAVQNHKSLSTANDAPAASVPTNVLSQVNNPFQFVWFWLCSRGLISCDQIKYIIIIIVIIIIVIIIIIIIKYIIIIVIIIRTMAANGEHTPY
jgi:hypothetical protein